MFAILTPASGKTLSITTTGFGYTVPISTTYWGGGNGVIMRDGTITITSQGLYLVSASVTISGCNSGDNISARIMRNTNLPAIAAGRPTGNGGFTISIPAAPMNLSSGDTLKLLIMNFTGARGTVEDNCKVNLIKIK